MKRSIVSREGVGLSATVIQKRELYLSRVVTDLPTLVFVKKGVKSLKHNDLELDIKSGEAVAIAGGQAFDVINRPHQGEFEAAWIAFHPNVIRNYKNNPEGTKDIDPAFIFSNISSGFSEAFRLARESITTDKLISDQVAIHRATEILIWLGEYGRKFKIPSTDNISQKVRSFLSANPAKDWSAVEIADRLEMSEATLRRRLSSELSSFSEILIDVRMSFALSLLQATDRTIGEIAREAGYDSASRFAVRFRDRFGYSPTMLRREAGRDRNGTILDRVRT
ncbi:AraC family transcriptional regulator [Leptospira licerasiae]|uniref:DNA-binding helix-turn-helix protein n=1 Tax=Leptospira licerasiae str. MMD4847 TaxID=1049971 RepID=A0ABP2RHS8_9LEPT|nr:AraC family transcriptional regulator [Leptospira licerasiae]EIE00422.1 DNA-binding helix-turn-helix protein [Leptospira licerasiae serovar Varillal str. VAR 010]EJZ43008.1 DNA-binding helix-turn-helix protein [Leptospira licerasiae str. MMD4847]